MIMSTLSELESIRILFIGLSVYNTIIIMIIIIVGLYFFLCRQSQNEVSQIKIKLQSYTDTAALVKSMKEEIENKSSKYDKLELENDALKKALDTKVCSIVSVNTMKKSRFQGN